MKNKCIGISLFITLLIALPGSILAQESDADSTPAVGPSKYGVGFQGTFPASGLSGMMNINDEVSVQAIFGFFGTLKTFAGRGLYKFQQEDYWNLYGYGMVGAWSYRGLTTNLNRTTETVLGLGAGGGIEYDWRSFNSELPPISWNIELGLGYVNFKDVDYNFTSILFGAGVHYRF